MKKFLLAMGVVVALTAGGGFGPGAASGSNEVPQATKQYCC